MARKSKIEETKDKINLDNLFAEIYINANKDRKRADKLVKNLTEVIGIRKKKGSTMTPEDILNKNSFIGKTLHDYSEVGIKANKQLLELADIIKDYQEKVKDVKTESGLDIGDKSKLYERIKKAENKALESVVRSEEELIN